MIIIKEWVRNIFMIVIAISFIEIILPSGKMKNYLQFIFSTIMLAVIIGPLAELPVSDVSSQDNTVNAFSTGSFLQDTEQAEADFTQKYTGYTIDIVGIYQDKIKEKISYILETDLQMGKPDQIELVIDERPVEQGGGYVKAIRITMEGSFDKEKVRDSLAAEIGIAKQAISIDMK